MKKYEVIKATTKNMKGVNVGGRKYKFGGNGSFTLSDSGVAAEIEQEYGHHKGNGDVVVSPINIEEHGHKYTFGPNKRYAKAWEALIERRKNKRKQSWVLDKNQEWELANEQE
jgi:hypothetical protein